MGLRQDLFREHRSGCFDPPATIVFRAKAESSARQLFRLVRTLKHRLQRAGFVRAGDYKNNVFGIVCSRRRQCNPFVYNLPTQLRVTMACVSCNALYGKKRERVPSLPMPAKPNQNGETRRLSNQFALYCGLYSTAAARVSGYSPLYDESASAATHLREHGVAAI